MVKRKSIPKTELRQSRISKIRSGIWKPVINKIQVCAPKPIIVEEINEDGKRILVVEGSRNKRLYGRTRQIASGYKSREKGYRVITGKSTSNYYTNPKKYYDVVSKKIRNTIFREFGVVTRYLNRELTFDEFRLACVESEELCRYLICNMVVYDGKTVKCNPKYIREVLADTKNNKTKKSSGSITPPTNNNNRGNGGDEEPDESPEYYEILSKIPTITVGDSRVYDTPLGGSSDESAGEALSRYAQELELKDIELSIITKINKGDISKIFHNKLQTATNKFKALIIALRLVPARSNYILGKIGISLSFVTSKEDKLLLGYIYTAPFDKMVTVKWCNDNLVENGCSPLIKHRGK